MKRRIFAIFLSFSLCMTALGCGAASTKTAPTPEAAKTLTIAARDGTYSDVLNAVKGNFEINNNCNVNVISLSANEIHDSAIADASNETGKYDIIMIDDPLMPEYIEKNILTNLTKLGYSDDEDFVEKSRLLGKDPYPLGATYALPFSGNVQLLFFNSNNVDISQLSDWLSIYDACTSAQESGKKGYVVRGQAGNPIVSDFLPILWAFGGDIFDDNNNVIIDSEESCEALEFFCKLYATGGSYEKNDLINAISSGEASVALGWPSWFISGSGASASYEQIPGKKSSHATTMTTGEIGNWLLGITSNSAEPDLSLELIKYMTSVEVQREALAYGGVPTRKSIFRDSEVLAKYPYFEAIYLGTNNSRVRPRTTKWSQIEDSMGAELMECLNGNQTVEKTITNIKIAVKRLVNS